MEIVYAKNNRNCLQLQDDIIGVRSSEDLKHIIINSRFFNSPSNKLYATKRATFSAICNLMKQILLKLVALL